MEKKMNLRALTCKKKKTMLFRNECQFVNLFIRSVTVFFFIFSFFFHLFVCMKRYNRDMIIMARSHDEHVNFYYGR